MRCRLVKTIHAFEFDGEDLYPSISLSVDAYWEGTWDETHQTSREIDTHSQNIYEKEDKALEDGEPECCCADECAEDGDDADDEAPDESSIWGG